MENTSGESIQTERDPQWEKVAEVHQWYLENRAKYPDFTVIKKIDLRSVVGIAVGNIKHPFLEAPVGLDKLTLARFDDFVATMKVRLQQYEADVNGLKSLWRDINPQESAVLVRDDAEGIRMTIGLNDGPVHLFDNRDKPKSGPTT